MSLARHYKTLGLRRGSSVREIKAAYRQLVRQYHPDINPDAQAVERFIKINDAYTAISETFHRYPVDTGVELTRTSSGVNSTPPEAPNPSQAASLETFSIDSLRLQLEQLGLGNFSDSGNYSDSNEAGFEASAIPESATSESVVSSPDTDPNITGFIAFETSTEAEDSPQTQAEKRAQEAGLKQDAYLQLKKLLKQKKFPRAIALVEGLAHRMPSDSEISQWQAIVYQRWGRQLISQGQLKKARIYLKKALRTDPNNRSLWREINQDFWHLANMGANIGVGL